MAAPCVQYGWYLIASQVLNDKCRFCDVRMHTYKLRVIDNFEVMRVGHGCGLAVLTCARINSICVLKPVRNNLSQQPLIRSQRVTIIAEP